MTQQCQPGASVTGQSAAAEGATVDTAKNGPAVMAVAGGQKQRSRRQPSLRPIQGQQGNPLSRHEDGAPVFRFLERLTRAQRLPREPLVPSHLLCGRTVGGTSGRRSGRRFAFAIMTASKKGAPRHLDFVFFPFSSFSLLQQGPGKGDTPKGILLREGNGP
jgi:hypothetical protein